MPPTIQIEESLRIRGFELELIKKKVLIEGYTFKSSQTYRSYSTFCSLMLANQTI